MLVPYLRQRVFADGLWDEEERVLSVSILGQESADPLLCLNLSSLLARTNLILFKEDWG